MAFFINSLLIWGLELWIIVSVCQLDFLQASFLSLDWKTRAEKSSKIEFLDIGEVEGAEYLDRNIVIVLFFVYPLRGDAGAGAGATVGTPNGFFWSRWSSWEPTAHVVRPEWRSAFINASSHLVGLTLATRQCFRNSSINWFNSSCSLRHQPMETALSEAVTASSEVEASSMYRLSCT